MNFTEKAKFILTDGIILSILQYDKLYLLYHSLLDIIRFDYHLFKWKKCYDYYLF